ncbi:hypothetical protein [Enhygromyxa salina]|uniref:hypothetical protein n=1 Tax=Enhygromyxa salina TaxID=215803 RepID=UPI0011B1CF6D|nr:hypothetical protein [Enhygromyxa salina]
MLMMFVLSVVVPTSARAAPSKPAPDAQQPDGVDPTQPPAVIEPAATEPAVIEPAATDPAAEVAPELEGGQASEDEAVTPPAPMLLPPPTPIEVDPANYRMVLAGNVVIGLGGAALIAMAVGLGLRADAVTQRQALSVGSDPDLDAIARQDQRIHTGAITGLTGGVAAGALFVTGITLVALGYERERRRRAAIPTATIGRDAVALNWSLRF